MKGVAAEPVVTMRDVSLFYGKTCALNDVSLAFPPGCLVGLIGPDGVGKSSLLSLIAGARRIQSGNVCVLGGDLADKGHRTRVCQRLAYMPQGLGKNLYPDLSVRENIEFFGRLFGQTRSERDYRIASLLKATGLDPFPDRMMSKLSGGMRQKLGLCCSLVHDIDLLILDEPTTGVDPLSRRQFWNLMSRMRAERPSMSVIIATAYMEEAEQCDWLVAMDAGCVLATGSPAQFKAGTQSSSLEASFVALLPQEQGQVQKGFIQALPFASKRESVIVARHLTRRFGAFTAVNDVNVDFH